MLIYNVTCKVNLEIAEEWVQWMKEIHIPDVLKTGRFENHKFLRLLDQDESDGITYAVQYFCPNAEFLNDYLQNHAPALKKLGLDRYKDQFVAFRTVLQEVE